MLVTGGPSTVDAERNLAPTGGRNITATSPWEQATTHPRSGPSRCCARAWRNQEIICGRVELTVREDTRLGLTPRERRRLAVRFVGRLDPGLWKELTELVRRRGAGSRRAAERMDPIELILDDAYLGPQSVVGWVQPPQRRYDELHEIEFDLREAS